MDEKKKQNLIYWEKKWTKNLDDFPLNIFFFHSTSGWSKQTSIIITFAGCIKYIVFRFQYVCQWYRILRQLKFYDVVFQMGRTKKYCSKHLIITYCQLLWNSMRRKCDSQLLFRPSWKEFQLLYPQKNMRWSMNFNATYD